MEPTNQIAATRALHGYCRTGSTARRTGSGPGPRVAQLANRPSRPCAARAAQPAQPTFGSAMAARPPARDGAAAGTAVPATILGEKRLKTERGRWGVREGGRRPDLLTGEWSPACGGGS